MRTRVGTAAAGFGIAVLGLTGCGGHSATPTAASAIELDFDTASPAVQTQIANVCQLTPDPAGNQAKRHYYVVPSSQSVTNRELACARAQAHVRHVGIAG